MKELIHFSASWCQPCKQMQPMLDKFISDNPDIVYTKYDADDNVSVFQEHGITGVPAFIAKVDGKQAFHKGLATEEKLASLFA
jgi:thioredoxin-like negative regulator of GroEL